MSRHLSDLNLLQKLLISPNKRKDFNPKILSPVKTPYSTSNQIQNFNLFVATFTHVSFGYNIYIDHTSAATK